MFIALKNHTTYSLCKGAIKVNSLVEKAKSLKMPALGIMDCGNLFAALEFSSACKKSGIQPILGCELLVDFQINNNKNLSNLDLEKSLCKTPLICYNEEGYKNLMYLVSHSYLNMKTGISPHVNFELLKTKSSGIIAFSACFDGIISKLISQNQDKRLDEIICEILKYFPDKNFFI